MSNFTNFSYYPISFKQFMLKWFLSKSSTAFWNKATCIWKIIWGALKIGKHIFLVFILIFVIVSQRDMFHLWKFYTTYLFAYTQTYIILNAWRLVQPTYYTVYRHMSLMLLLFLWEIYQKHFHSSTVYTIKYSYSHMTSLVVSLLSDKSRFIGLSVTFKIS